MGNTQEKNTSQNSMLYDESPTTKLFKNTYQYLLSSENDGSTRSTTLTLDALKAHLHVDGCNYSDTFVRQISCRFISAERVTESEFIQVGDELTSLSPGSRRFNEYYTSALSTSEADLSKDDVLGILESAFCVACTLNKLNYRMLRSSELSRPFQPVLDSMFSREEVMSRDTMMSWVQRHVTLMFASLHAWTLERWRTPALPSAKFEARSSTLLDQITPQKSLLSIELVYLLSCTLPLPYCSSQYGHGGNMASLFHWLSLYDSNVHGLSVNRFDHHVFEYKGPTVSLISFEEHVYLIASGEEWRDSIDRWGGQHSMMVELAPKYRVVQGGASLCFLNLTSRTVPKGFQFGKDGRSVMLEIDEDMLHVSHFGIKTKLDRFEVWGCGSQAVRDMQLNQKQWEQNQVEKHKNRKLKLDDWKNSPDRMLLEMGGVKVTHSEEHCNE